MELIFAFEVLLFLLYSFVAQTVFSAFTCVEVDEQLSLLAADVSMECGSEQHRDILAAGYVLLLIYVLGIPLHVLAVVLVLRRRGQLDEVKAKLTVGFLYRSYRREAVYYEVVVMARKMTMIAVVSTLNQVPGYQCAGSVMILMIFNLIHVNVQPFVDRTSNMLEFGSLSCTALTFYAAQAFFLEPAQDEHGNPEDRFASALNVSAIVVNILMTLVFIVQIVRDSISWGKGRRTSASNAGAADHTEAPPSYQPEAEWEANAIAVTHNPLIIRHPAGMQ